MSEEHRTERLLPRFSLHRPVTVVMLLVALLVIGSIAYSRIKLDLFPEGMQAPYMSVYVPYQNASPKEVEEQIVKNVEGELKTVKNLKRVFSRSGSNGCFVSMEFAQGTNMDLAYSQVSDRMERALPKLPDDVEFYYIRRHREGDEPIVYMAVAYPPEMEDPYYVFNRHIKRAVEGVNGVASVELFGIREKYIQIIVDADKMKAYRVNLSRVVQELQQDNFAISGGYTHVGPNKLMVRVSSRFHSLEDIDKVEIGRGLRLSHIAQVVFAEDEEERSISRLNGLMAAGLSIQKESNANTVEVCNQVVRRLEEQFATQKDLKGAKYSIFWNQGEAITQSIDNVKETGLWGGFFAFLVLFFFLRQIRLTVMLTLAIPLSLLATVLALYFIGWTLNTITMMGLMLSIGLVVDNAIVITENIYRYRGLNVPIQQAALWGASEVGLAITLATLTTVVVFLPMMVAGGDGMMTFFMVRLGFPVIIALLSSLLIALVFIPLGASRLLARTRITSRQSTHSAVVQMYQNAMVRILKHRRDALMVIVLLILSLFIPFGRMKRNDSMSGGTRDAFVRVDFPTHFSLQKRDETMQRIVARIMERDNLYHLQNVYTDVSSFRGRIELYAEPDPYKQWYQVVWRKISGLFSPHRVARLDRAALGEDLKNNLPVIPGVTMRTTWRDQGGGDDASVSFTLRGNDVNTLLAISEDLEKQIRMMEGVIGVENPVEQGKDEIHVQVDREKAYKVGADPGYVARYVAFSLRPRQVGRFQTEDKEVPVMVKFRPEQRAQVIQLRNNLIQTEGEAATTLDAIAKLNYQKSLGSIFRENGKAFVELKISTTDENLRDVGQRLDTLFRQYRFPTGYSYEQGQRFRRFEEDEEEMGGAIWLSVTMVVLLMGILFESFVLPLSILVAIPAAFVGSFWMVFLTGTAFDTMAGIGLVILVGVVVNNGIVLIDLINQYRGSGMNREQAILVAGMHRFRPIMMTAMTTICGLIPMAIGNASLIGIPYAPMGITMIGGLVSSTFLTLFAVPVFYTYFDDMRNFFAVWVRRFF